MAQTKATIARKVFSLKSKEYITPNYIRVTLGGDVSEFQHATVGDNNKIFIPPKRVDKVQFPMLDIESKKWIFSDMNTAPTIRTYTHSGIDLSENELYIDFVNHGENGPASAWALNSKIGDQLGVAMRTTPKELYPSDAEWFLLIGDATAIPVLRAILSSLPGTASGVCVIQVPSKEDVQQLQTEALIEFTWLIENGQASEDSLANRVRKITIPSIAKFGYVACEFSTVKQIRSYLRKELQWSSKELYAYSYWKQGVAEDKSVADRQQEKKRLE